MDKCESVFDSYNKMITAVYDKLFEGKNEKDIMKVSEAVIDRLMQEGTDRWVHAPLEELDGAAPESFFNSLNTPEELGYAFNKGAVHCDTDLPRIFTDKIIAMGDGMTDFLISKAAGEKFDALEETSITAVAAIKLISSWKIENAAEPLLDIACKCNDDKETVIEAITEAIKNIGPSAIDPLVRILENFNCSAYAEEFLLNALSDIGHQNKSEKIYRCIKNVFLRIENKKLGAVCAADYGDSRMIPALKGFVRKNKGMLDKATFYEIRAAVKQLGGIIEDMTQ